MIFSNSKPENVKGAYKSELEIDKSGDTSWATFIAKLLD